MRTHGIQQVNHNSSKVEEHAEAVSILGYTVVEDVLDATQLAEARERIDAVYERQVEEFGGQDALERINDADLARCLLSYDDFFVDVAADRQVTDVVEELLGDYVVLMAQNAIINRPRDDHYQHTWHRDLNYQHFTSSEPIAISALYCIDDFSAETGGTYLLPASHRDAALPSPEFVERNLVMATAPAGSVLVFDAMLFHRAGVNSSGRIRRAVNHIYTRPFVQQQISLPDALGGRHADDPRLRRLLGYEAPPAASAMEWRRQRLARLDAAPTGNGAGAR